MATPVNRLEVYLIKPSKYDDDGYVIRYWRGVLPSNTLAALYSLTEDTRQRRALGHIEIKTHLLDETIQTIPVDRIARAQRPGVKVVVMLAGVQTNQFPRAADLARQFRQRGVAVWLGGFHVSGILAMFPTVAPEVQELLDLGVTIVKGEVEGHWDDLLRDIVADTARPLYDFSGEPPDLTDRPLPRLPHTYLQHFARPNMATLDTSRGCPFDCSFCCIINVQGRQMRCRDPQAVLAAVRENYHTAGISDYFFTDDNFSRNKHWEAILDGLIYLREMEGLPLGFMMQCDVLSYRLPHFIEKARRAGCGQVFLGIESVNPANLQSAEKRQNTLNDIRQLTAAWHAAGIVTHAAYIIGFPHDTPASVREDLRFLTDELQVEQASFFMLGPIPGSRDHRRLVEAGVPLDQDYNRYDSFHPNMPHPHMSGAEWYTLYRECWRLFYSFDNMRAILGRIPPKNYWAAFFTFIWIKNSAEIEGEHPMISGFWRFRDRLTRRPGYVRPNAWQHFWSQAGAKANQAQQWVQLIREMQELWLQTRPPTRTERRLLNDFAKLQVRAPDWINSLHLPELPNTNIAEVRRALNDWVYVVWPAFLQHRREALGASLAQIQPLKFNVTLPNLWDKMPPEMREWVVRAEQYTQSLQASRRRLDWFWLQAWHNLRAGKFWRVRPSLVVFNSARDLWLTLRFAWAMLTSTNPSPRDSALL